MQGNCKDNLIMSQKLARREIIKRMQTNKYYLYKRYNTLIR